MWAVVVVGGGGMKLLVRGNSLSRQAGKGTDGKWLHTLVGDSILGRCGRRRRIGHDDRKRGILGEACLWLRGWVVV